MAKKKKGWAGQWDRHRWPAKAVESQRRLRSLDEFEPLPWHARARRSPIAWSQVGLMVLAGVFVGLVWAVCL